MEKWLTKPRFNGETLFVSQRVEKIIGKWGEKYNAEYCTMELKFYDDGFIFANEFLDIMNKRFGTNYPFDNSYKNEKGKRHNNIHYHWNFEITNNLELLHHYYFDGNSTSFIGLGGIATATFGDFTEEEYKQMANAVDYYNQHGNTIDSRLSVDYYDIDARKAINEKYNAEISDINHKKNPMIDALSQSLNGDMLTEAINRINTGFYWTERGARDRMRDSEHNEELNEKARILQKLVDEYGIKGNVVTNKKETYFSIDDRLNHNSLIRFDKKEDIWYSISVDKYSKEVSPTFKIHGEIVTYSNRVIFNCNNLSAEELKKIVNYWFKECDI